MYCYNNIWLSW